MESVNGKRKLTPWPIGGVPVRRGETLGAQERVWPVAVGGRKCISLSRSFRTLSERRRATRERHSDAHARPNRSSRGARELASPDISPNCVPPAVPLPAAAPRQPARLGGSLSRRFHPIRAIRSPLPPSLRRRAFDLAPSPCSLSAPRTLILRRSPLDRARFAPLPLRPARPSADRFCPSHVASNSIGPFHNSFATRNRQILATVSIPVTEFAIISSSLGRNEQVRHSRVHHSTLAVPAVLSDLSQRLSTQIGE